MIEVVFRGLLSRKLRTALTMIAILLGVAMISGTYILTDTINASFSQIFNQANSKTDVVVSGKQAIGSQFSQPPAFPESLLTVVRNTPGVASASGAIGDQAQLVGKNGKSLGAVGGAPNLLFSYSGSRFSQLKLVQGHFPHGNEVVLDKDTVQRNHLKLGQTVGVAGVGAVQQFKIVGIVKFGTVGSIGGASIIAMDLPTAQRITGKVGKLDQIRVVGQPGISPADLVGRIKARIPPNLRGSLQVQTGQQNADQTTAAIGQGLSALTNILLAFGAIALFVGAFVIFNTFSITVAQRTREFAMLRTVGATRAQVLRSVLLEALAIGVVASLLGLVAGIGLSKALNGLFLALGVDLPNTGLQLQARTVIVALAVGIVVTVLASAWPAVRATRVPPVAALQEGFQLPKGRFSRFAPAIAGVLTIIGIALVVLGVFGSYSSIASRLTVIGVGCFLLFVGIAMLSPVFIRPMAEVIGWPVARSTAITGTLARENTMRNPGRTAVTAAALMVGLAVVGFVTIFAAELKVTADDALQREVAGTYAIYNDQNLPIPGGVGAAVAQVPGVAGVSSIKVDSARIAGVGDVQTNGIQAANFTKFYRFQWKQGSDAVLSHLGPHDAVIDENLAKDHHLKVSSVLHVTTPAGTHHTFVVRGIYKHSQFLTDLTISYPVMAQVWQLPKDFIVLVNAAPGQNVGQLETRIKNALATRYPTAAVHSQADYRKQQDKNINQLLAFVYVLLAMSVLVSLFGIINTLVLSIYERTREIGMLRAIGTTRTQVRWVVRWESVITSVIGAILGLVVGVALAFLVTAGLSSQGLEYTLPIGSLLIWVVFAMVFGIVAAAWPARRAARLDVLQAVAYE